MMSSNETGSHGSFPVAFLNESTGAWLFGADARLRLVRDVVTDSEIVLTRAAAAMGRAEREIDRLWRDSMRAEDREMSQRLAEVSHALHRAARLLEPDGAIG